MIEAPIYYDWQNAKISQIKPGVVKVRDNATFGYFVRYLLQKTISVFKWKMPKAWAENYFLYCLYCFGFVAIVNTTPYGVIPQRCGLRGYNVMYQPTNAIITNPLLRGLLEPEIDTDCVLMRLQPDYGGIMDLVYYYAEQMTLCSEAISMNLVNSKLAYVFAAENKAAAESFKQLYDQISTGVPAVVQDKKLLGDDGKPTWQAFAQNVKQTYITSDILSDMRKLESMFDTAIGLPNANTDKRERLVTDEVNANNVETYTRCAMWLEELKAGCEKARNMFGIELDVDWRISPLDKPEGGVEDAKDQYSGA